MVYYLIILQLVSMLQLCTKQNIFNKDFQLALTRFAYILLYNSKTILIVNHYLIQLNINFAECIFYLIVSITE